jgi:addiction module HigA family antidote
VTAKYTPRVRNPFHPGVILEEEFLEPMEITQTALAKAIGTTHAVVNEICRGKRGVSAAMALKLARYFKMTPEFWMNLQMHWDLWKEWERSHSKKAG